MSYRLSQNARNTKDLLEELERDKEFDVLREYLMRFELFPRQRDLAAAPIRFEELKELAKHWNLHRQRYFWKTNSTKEELARTLYHHINTKIIPLENGGGKSSQISAVESTALIPEPPPRHNPGSTSEVHRKRATIRPIPPDRVFRADSVFNGYKGDLFGQRGNYEDGMIYLSRFPKRAALFNTRGSGDSAVSDNHTITTLCSNDGQDKNDDMKQLSAENVDLLSGTTRETRLKQECAFSIYHFSTITGHEKKMVAEGCMLALSKLTVFEDLEVKRFCAASILNLLCESPLGSKMADEGMLMACLELAKVQHEEVRRHTSMALCRFSYERAGQLRLVQEGCVSAIVSMVNVPDVETKETCVKTLINIASSTSTTVAESVVHVLLKLATRTDVASVKFAAKAIANLSLLSGSRAKVLDDGVLDTVWQLVHRSSSIDDKDGETVGSIRKHLATALCNMSGISSNLERLNHARILECLVELLKFDKPQEVRELSAVTIANISSYPSSLNNLVLSEALSKLVEIATHQSSVFDCENTALCLSNMAATADSRAVLTRIGVVPLLLRFVEEDGGDPNFMAQQFAILTLCSLLTHSETCMELLQSNILAAIAKLANRTPHDRVRDLCANALSNASYNKTLQAALLHNDTIHIIVRLCRRKEDTDDESVSGMFSKPATPIGLGSSTVLTRSQECALVCLFNLSFVAASRASLGRSDVVSTLTRVFTRLPARVDEPSRQCAAILANLSFDVEACHRVMIDNGIRLIRRFMTAATASAVAAAASDVPVSASELAIVRETLRCCATACCNVAVDALDKTPVLDMLIELSGSTYKPTTLTCAIAFAKLTQNAKNRAQLARSAELYPALTLMMRCGIEDIQIYSAVALCNLAVEPPTAKPVGIRHVWKEGTVSDFIVNALLRINSDSTKEICARALFNLLTHEELRPMHIKDGVLYALVKLARLDSVAIRTLCVTALYNISCEPALVETLMELKVAQVITKLCEMEFSNQINYRKLAACLTNLASETTISSDKRPNDVSAISSVAVRLVESGALIALLVMCKRDDFSTRHACAAALCSLSAYDVNCEAIATLGLVDVLTNKLLSHAEDTNTSMERLQRQQNQYALNALCNISRYPALHDRIIDAAALPQTIRILAANLNQEDDAIVLICVQTLDNLTFHARHRQALITHKLVATLLCCAHTLRRSTQVGDVCAETIAVLCEDPLHWHELVDAGAVRVLRELLLDGETQSVASQAALRASVYALSQLVRCEKTGEMVLADGALDVVAHALDLKVDAANQNAIENRQELAERCAVIIRALSTQSDSVRLMLMLNARLVPLINTIVNTCSHGNYRQRAGQHVILAFYNLTSCRLSMDDVNEENAVETMQGLDTMVMNGVVPLLIRLSKDGGSDMAPACAVALAHVKHRIKERLAMSQVQKDRRFEQRELLEMDELMEDGVVTALLAMFELDTAGIQRVDRQAATMPPTLPVLRVATLEDWTFHAGNSTLPFERTLPVTWDFCDPANDELQYVPSEPQSFLSLLSPVVCASGATIQDKLYGHFEILKVSPEKCRLRLEDSRFAKLATAFIEPAESTTDGTTDLSDAIAMAIDEDDDQARSRAMDDDGNETRTPSFVNKKLTSRTLLARDASNSENSALSISPSSDNSVLGRVRKTTSTHAVTNHSSRALVQNNRTNLLGKSNSNRRFVHDRFKDTSSGVILPKII
ncbi:Armadillo-type fold [Plasmopara halstedii]|uniref:Armadillo-type fold n=1 Tax=Plasmopara halstedii TaxID=4781 RepID=A0A0P1AQ90_PLAHL|nr:Armadillo-type fold [Plasmopara halstedii]CEG42982.1 Armadillo-type fold [Plasmopara halstedii]|eukprot:XP_024579351.1 Armadillo-type fold [Plasmopara halstedii]